jgi:23S rRNA (guanine2445-N2)-methyltransferase / 23S rRNA (guanine2069-N7)-methyltransferase
MEFFATCPTGFEQLLAAELSDLNTPRVRPLQGQVAFEGTLVDAYRACLWSHLASRVIAVLVRGCAATSDELYATVLSVPWEEHVGAGSSFAVDATGTNAQLRTTQFVALRAKDAIADRLASEAGVQAPTDPKNPDVGVVVRISRDRAAVGIDLAGATLFQRGYERSGNRGNLRPDYAAALLRMAGWHELCKAGEPTLLDITQGSGTIVVEAALMAAHRAPGLLRLKWGFQGWAQHDADAWDVLVGEARQNALETPPAAFYVPASTKTGSAIRASMRAAGLDPTLTILGSNDLAQAKGHALLTCDLSALRSDDLVRKTSALNELERVSSLTQPTRAVLLTRDHLGSSFLMQEPTAQLQTFLGKEPLYIEAYEGTAATQRPSLRLGDQNVSVLVPASDQFAARLKKVIRQRTKWAQREDVTCYRVYDADLPDYAVAIDLYQGTDPSSGMPNGMRWLQVAKYAAPKGIDQTVAQARLMDVLTIAPRLLEVDPRHTYLRIRRRDKGGSQYAEEAKKGSIRPRSSAKDGIPLPPGAHLVDEGGLTFEVNFSSRLDCGIFLDHRDTRAMLREMAKETAGSKRFLNLFAYTGTATCYAADGGMKYTTTVDLSRPSLNWARRNMERNGFAGKEHEYVQADVVRWVSEQRHTRNRWDLVFCDVPTFSNSSRMGKRSFDVQRDHAELLIGVSRLLMRGGTCVFSCNLRSFKPDAEKLAKAGVEIEDITAKTIPEDFARNPRIHHTYLVRRASVGSSPL